YEKLVDIEPYIVQTSDVLSTQQTEKRAHDSDEDKRNENYIRKKQRQESLSPKRRSASPPSILPEVSALTYESSPTVSNVISGDDPLTEMIAETKHLVDEGFLLDDYDDESQSVQGEMSDSEDEMIESSTQNEKGPTKSQRLKVLLDHYQRMKDEWRVLSYRKAISAIKRQKEPITSYQEAIEIRGIGHRTAEKIAEIINTGNLKRLQHFSKDDEVIKKFSDIH
ncbi:26218_t:CDS:2, partial [Racocetra persica]